MHTSPSILLVEDDDDDVVLALRALRRSDLIDANVHRVDRLAALAVSAAAESFPTPDLVLLDLTLPDSAGLDTLSHVRGLFADIPIIVLTGIDDERLGIEALRAGAEDYVRKGTGDVDRLARTLRYAYERYQFRQRDPEPEIYHAHSGLPGRTIFIDRLTMALRRGAHANAPVAVANMRCDGVSLVADRYGAKTAEVFQRALIKRLVHRLDLTDTLADLGGGEFAGIIESALAASPLEVVRKELIRAFADPVTVSGPSGLLELSPLPTRIGLSAYPADGRTVPALLARAMARSSVVDNTG